MTYPPVNEDGADPAAAISRTLVDQLTASLRLAILDGEMHPGERLTLKKLTSRFSVSHIPIREALLRLEGEGLVVHQPHRGVTVAGVSLDEIDAVYDARKILETAIARRAIVRAARDDLTPIEAALEGMRATAAGADIAPYIGAHRHYHWLMLKSGATPTLEQILRQLWQTSERYVRFVLTVGKAMQLAQAHHEELYGLFRRGDADAFVDLVELHLDATRDHIREALNRMSSATSDGNSPSESGLALAAEASSGV